MSVTNLVILALVIGGFMLFSRLAKRAVERARRQALDGVPPPPPSPEDAPLDPTWGPGPPAQTWQGATDAELARRVDTIAPGIRPPHRRAASGRLFRTRKDLRHAVVVMTVLGPCRALNPPDRD